MGHLVKINPLLPFGELDLIIESSEKKIIPAAPKMKGVFNGGTESNTMVGCSRCRKLNDPDSLSCI